MIKDHIKIFNFIIRIISNIRKRQFIYIIFLSLTTAFIDIISLLTMDVLLKKILSKDIALANFEKSEFFFVEGLKNSYLIDVLLILALLLLIGLFIKIFTYFLQQKYAANVGTDVAQISFTSILEKPYEWHTNKNSASSLNILTKDLDRFTVYIEVLMNFITNFVITLVICIWMIKYSFIYFSVFSLLLLSFLFLIYLFLKDGLRTDGKLYSNYSELNIKVIQETLGSIREIIVNNTLLFYKKRFIEIYQIYRNTIARLSTRTMLARPIIENVVIISILSIAVFYKTSSNGTKLDITIAGTILFGALRILQPIQNCFMAISNFEQTIPSVKNILNSIDLQKTSSKRNLYKKLIPKKTYNFNVIKMESVSFTYPNSNEKAINNISLEIERGDKVGIVGITGSGKSTLVDILLGLLEPTHGEIKVDNKNLKDKTFLNDWTTSISYLSQNIYIRDVSVAENIASSEHDGRINMSRIKRISKIAEIDGFIESLPKGYLTKIGERGIRLSGGQRQRIALAAALYKKSKLIILDEGTSALDVQTERKILMSIQKDLDANTFIYITHRLKTLETCNKIYILKKGEIIEYGSYDELNSNSKIFKELKGI